MDSFDAEINQRLAAIREQGLYRELRRVDSPQLTRIQIGGEEFLNFSSNDYLGLANEPALKDAAIKAVEQFGAGAGASRLICGSLSSYHELEETLAEFKNAEASLSFSTGYAAAIGTICALLGKEVGGGKSDPCRRAGDNHYCAATIHGACSLRGLHISSAVNSRAFAG